MLKLPWCTRYEEDPRTAPVERTWKIWAVSLAGAYYLEGQGDSVKENGDHYIVYWGYIGIMEKKGIYYSGLRV